MNQFERIIIRQKRDEWLRGYHETLYKSRMSMIDEIIRGQTVFIKYQFKKYRHMWE